MVPWLPLRNTMEQTTKSEYSEEGKYHIPNEETRAQVSALASFGHDNKEIAAYLMISEGKLRQMYSDELRKALIEANMSVAGALKKVAEKGNVVAQMFWLKNRAADQWKDKVTHQHSGDSGSGPTVNIHVTQAAPPALSAPADPPIEGVGVLIKASRKVKAIAHGC